MSLEKNFLIQPTIREDIEEFFQKDFGVLPKNVEMILYYQEKSMNNLFVLLGNSEKIDRWNGCAVDKRLIKLSNQSINVISMGHLLMDEYLWELKDIVINPIKNGFS